MFYYYYYYYYVLSFLYDVQASLSLTIKFYLIKIKIKIKTIDQFYQSEMRTKHNKHRLFWFTLALNGADWLAFVCKYKLVTQMYVFTFTDTLPPPISSGWVIRLNVPGLSRQMGSLCLQSQSCIYNGPRQNNTKLMATCLISFTEKGLGRGNLFYLGWYWKRFKMNKKGWTRLKKVF